MHHCLETVRSFFEEELAHVASQIQDTPSLEMLEPFVGEMYQDQGRHRSLDDFKNAIHALIVKKTIDTLSLPNYVRPPIPAVSIFPAYPQPSESEIEEAA